MADSRRLCFVSGGSLVDGPQPPHVIFRGAVVEIDPVLLLLDVRQLRIAEAEHVRVIQQHVGQPLVASKEVVRTQTRAVIAPARPRVAGRFDVHSSIFADEERLATIAAARVAGIIVPGFAAGCAEHGEAGGEGCWILLVVVGIENICLGQQMRVSARIEERARWVHCAGCCQQGFEAGDMLIGASFVEWAPANDRRMIAVAADNSAPLVHKTAHRFLLRDIHPPTGELAPEQIAQLVRPVEGARLEDLLVEPRPVEPRGHRKLDVAAERLVTGRGVDAIGVEALVKDESLEDRPVVDEKAIALDGDFAEATVAANAVQHLASPQGVQWSGRRGRACPPATARPV